MIERYIRHIPAKHFKMVRYYGFLSSRKRGELLPMVYGALQMEERKIPEQPGFAALIRTDASCAATAYDLPARRLAERLHGIENDGFRHRPQDNRGIGKCMINRICWQS